jgi:hypothetical protein
MAKAKPVLNRSEAIREAYEEWPDAKAKEIVSHLQKKGIEVNEGLVYQVRKMSKKKNAGKAPPAKVVQAKAPQVKAAPQVKSSPAPSSNGVLSVGASIVLVKATAHKVGGFAALKEIVEALQ